MVDANALVEGITFRICRYIEASLPLRVVKMAAEFVLDDYGQAWFTHTSELLTVPKEARWVAASGNMKSQVSPHGLAPPADIMAMLTPR